MERELDQGEVDEMIEGTFGVKRRDVAGKPPAADLEDFRETIEFVGDGDGKRVRPNPDLPIIDVTVDPAPARPAPAAPPAMRKWLVGGGIATIVVVGGVIAWRRMTRATAEGDANTNADAGASGDPPTNPNTPPKPTPKPAPKPASEGDSWWTRVPSLPTAAEAPGFDLANNWGGTPEKMRPLFALMEKVSKIQGSARIFALISKREADFQPAAHNTSTREIDGSRRAYKNARDRNQPLTYGEASGEFGSGGLFGALGPYFLWTGVQEMKGAAPLLKAPPEVMFVPRIAAFGAVVYLQRILRYYQVDDHADIKVGWASPSLLKDGRGGSTYKAVRTRFFADASKLGLDLEDTSTIPAHLSSDSWPGVATAFTSLTGITVEETAEG